MASELKWRRKWKPTLVTKSWHPLSYSENYFVKYIFTAKSYEIMITDMKHSFFESLENADCQRRNKKLNPNVEAPMGVLLGHIKEKLDEQDANSKSVTLKRSDDRVLLKLNTKIGGLPFHWEFKLTACDTDQVAEHVTIPLSGLVGELLRQQAELVKIIHNKDKEIEDYKNQGVKVTRRHLQTNPFDEMAFKNDMITSKGFESRAMDMSAYTFTSEGQDLYENIMVKQAYLKREVDEDDEDDDITDRITSTSPAKNKMTANSWANNRVPGSLAVSASSAHSSPSKSPAKSPNKSLAASQDTTSPIKDTELLRRQALERRLADEEGKQEEKQKKKKKKLKL